MLSLVCIREIERSRKLFNELVVYRIGKRRVEQLCIGQFIFAHLRIVINNIMIQHFIILIETTFQPETWTLQ